MKVDKQQALELRQQGYTHQQIADTLGCSVAWCKANLKGVRKPSTDAVLIESIRQKGKSKDGVTTGEIKALTKQHYPTLSTKQINQKVESLKQAAKKGNSDVVIRPYWLLPDQPQATIDRMMDLAQSIYERINSHAIDFRKEFDLDESYHKSVVYQLVALSAGENNNLLPQGIVTYGDYLRSVSETLSDRHNE